MTDDERETLDDGEREALDDGERETSDGDERETSDGDDAPVDDGRWFDDGPSSDVVDEPDGGADRVGAAGEREADESAESSAEPLGGLRDRVADGDEAGPASASFPADASATVAGRGGEDDETSSDADDVTDSGDAATDESADPAVGRDEPLGELAAGVDGRRNRKPSTDDALFDEVEVGEVDADELWSQVATDGPTVEARGGREVREVEKRKYCSQCPYFSEPPEVGCSHDGTDILQQVDMEHFEVADCPVVLEDERLEDVTTE